MAEESNVPHTNLVFPLIVKRDFDGEAATQVVRRYGEPCCLSGGRTRWTKHIAAVSMKWVDWCSATIVCHEPITPAGTAELVRRSGGPNVPLGVFLMSSHTTCTSPPYFEVSFSLFMNER